MSKRYVITKNKIYDMYAIFNNTDLYIKNYHLFRLSEDLGKVLCETDNFIDLRHKKLNCVTVCGTKDNVIIINQKQYLFDMGDGWFYRENRIRNNRIIIMED